MIELKLPWPPASLSPNGRLHWARLAAAKGSYRRNCWGCTLAQLEPQQRAQLPDLGDLGLVLEFYPPNARKMDRDNLLARMKSGLDGMCDALSIDDARFEPITVSMKSPLRAGMVKVKIFTEGAQA